MEHLLKTIYKKIKKTPSDNQSLEDLFYMCKETMKTDIKLAVQYLVSLSAFIENQITHAEKDKDLMFLFTLHRRVLLAAAPFDFESYILYIEWNREPSKKFYPPRRFALSSVVEALQELADDKLDLLAVSLPPGCGKTTLAIFYLTWLAGRVPDKPMLTGSHSNSFVRGVYDECLRIFETNGDYLWHDVFPLVSVVNTNAKDCRIDLDKRKRFETINTLNEMMFAEDKATQDQEIVEWQMICGTAFRLVLPDEPGDEDEAPFEMYTLDPRDTFIVYSNEVGSKPLMAVKYAKDDNEITYYSVYTANRYYLIEEGMVKKNKSHALDMIPIFEYPANTARLGSFEIVLPLLDTINNLESNRMDGVEQFIQAFWKFLGCKIDKDLFREFLEEGAILVPPNDNGGNMDVDLIVKELNQDQTQTLKKNLYDSVLTICGMPNRNGGSSTSDTGAAVIMRDGWSLAEARAKDSEHIFKKSENKMLKLVLRICRDLGNVNLHMRDISLKFTRRNYEAIQSKSQVLIAMLNCPQIHPQLAFESSGMFVDSESAYTLSMKYYEEQQAKATALIPLKTPDDKKDGNKKDDV